MGVRGSIGKGLESVVGPERTDALRRAERSLRNRVAHRLAVDAPPAKRAKRGPGALKKAAGPKAAGPKSSRASDPFTPHPQPTMSRHELLGRLHERLQPRTYLEIGVNQGHSMALSRTRSIGVDPAFKITEEIRCDVALIRSTSDDFFAEPEAVAHFGGIPVDLAFIDGMHLSEFALRDFINTEQLMAPTGVVVLDDMLPRNVLEAARVRRTNAWAGDVFKVAEVLRRNRPDLVVLPVNTSPTGTVVIAGVDAVSGVLKAAYEAHELDYCTTSDPQDVPQPCLDRSTAVNAAELLDSPVWTQLVERRDTGDLSDLSSLWTALVDLPRGR